MAKSFLYEKIIWYSENYVYVYLHFIDECKERTSRCLYLVHYSNATTFTLITTHLFLWSTNIMSESDIDKNIL